LPLSEKRIQVVIKEVKEQFASSSTGRKLVKPVYLSREDARMEKEGFMKFGFNTILDKIWFVDGVFEGAEYAYEGIGSDFGEGLGESETTYVVNQILEKCKGQKISYEEKIRPSDILRLLEQVGEAGAEAKIILSSIKDHLQLWRYPNLKIQGKLGVPKAFSGYDHDVKIEFFRGLPEGTSIAANSERLGELLIKQRVDDVITIENIKESERAKLISEIPSLSDKDLSEKVRFLAYETIKIEIKNPEAVAILEKAPSLSSQVKII
jgi:hypothetical protein